MKAPEPRVKITVVTAALVAAILVLMPFHAFLTVWSASLVGHYTLLRLWKEILLVLLGAGSVYLLIKYPKLRWKLISYKLHWLIAAYALVQIVWGLVAISMHGVIAKALGYAWISNLRFLVFFLSVWMIFTQTPKHIKRWPQWVVWSFALVVLVGLLQYFVLPYDILKHAGYGNDTIFPYETINHNVHRLRIMSTLRGANPLGAYLVLALSLVAVLWHKQRKIWLGALFGAGLLALYLTFSRSAWIGFILSLGVLVWAHLQSERARRLALISLTAITLIGGTAGLALRHNTTFQDVVLHTNDHSAIKTTSDQGHASALRGGVHDLVHNPLGRGPGTAGPASVHNNHPARIAENYFVQIGQETGWIGLGLFAAINVVVARALWRRRQQTLALGLFAALIGITFVNLLSHAWADDTLAYLWWGLAGIAVATNIGAKDEV